MCLFNGCPDEQKNVLYSRMDVHFAQNSGIHASSNAKGNIPHMLPLDSIV